MTAGGAEVGSLRRVRWAVRGALTLGVAASVAANILHAAHNPVSQAIAGWPPVALLLTVELVARVPVQARRLAWARIASTVVIATIAAWVSYWHMAAVAHRFGEAGLSGNLLPISVDGLIVVGSVSLVELAGRIRTLQASTLGEARLPVAATTLAAAPRAGHPSTPSAAGPVRVTAAKRAGVGEPTR